MIDKRRKSRIKEWRNWYRFRRFQNITVTLLLTAALVVLLVGLLIRTSGAQNLKALPQFLNTYSNLALTALAFVTAVATLAYARLTRSILLEMIEARRAEIRPFVRVTFDKPTFRIDSRSDPLLHLNVAVQIANHGRGPAIGIRARVHVPYALDEQGTPKDWIGTDISWAGPAILEAGGELAGDMHLIMKPEYNLPERFSEFLELEARYEDVHQGLYCLRQYYDLFDYGASERKFLLTLRYEALYHFPFERRKSVRDTDMGMSLAWGEAPVHERRIPWSD